MTTTLQIAPQVGDILHASWGYDATWNDFYEVVAVTPTQVKIRELKKEYYLSSNEQHYGRHAVRPVFGEYKSGETLTRKFKTYSADSYYVKLQSYSIAVLDYDADRVYTDSMYC